MGMLHEYPFWCEMDLQWFAEGDEEETDEEREAREVKEAEDATKKLEVDGLSEEELKALVRKLDENNKKLSGLSRERLHEIMEKKAKLKEIEKKEREEKEAALKEKEKYKELYEGIKPKYDVLEKDVAKTHTLLEEEFEMLKENLPEEYRKLIPKTDIREQVSWMKNFQLTVVEKDESGSDEKKKGVGGGGGPPKKGSKTDVGKSAIEEQIQNCKTAEELEELLGSYGRNI